MEENKTTNNKKVIKSRKARNRALALMLTAVIGVGGIHTYKHVTAPTYTLNTTTMTKELESTINYNSLNDYKLITITDLNGQEKYIIGKKSLLDSLNGNYKVTNLLNDQVYYIKDDSTLSNEVYISNVEDIEDYLITLNYLKEEYTSEDLENILKEIIEYKSLKMTLGYNNIIKVRV